MTETTGEDRNEFFDPRPEADSAGRSDSNAVGTNAVRALLLGLMLSGADEAMFGLDEQFSAVGLEPDVPPVLGWGERFAVAERSDSILLGFDVPFTARADSREGPERILLEERVALWSGSRTAPSDPALSVAWLRTVMLSAPDAPDGVAAAAALSHWRSPGRGARVPAFLSDAKNVLARASGSLDPVARDIALAARGVRGVWPGSSSGPGAQEPTRYERPSRETTLSTCVHGTWGWRGDWWYPGGDFHSFLQSDVRPNVYSGGAPFSWSGGYFSRSRAKAALRLARWVEDAASNHVDSVFAHSYGGGITLMSTAEGARYDRVVLLSVPVHNDYDVEWRNIGRAQSVRLSFDLVLAAARAKQRFKANVEEWVLPLYPWRHSATHEPKFWSDYGVAATLDL